MARFLPKVALWPEIRKRQGFQPAHALRATDPRHPHDDVGRLDVADRAGHARQDAWDAGGDARRAAWPATLIAVQLLSSPTKATRRPSERLSTARPVVGAGGDYKTTGQQMDENALRAILIRSLGDCFYRDNGEILYSGIDTLVPGRSYFLRFNPAADGTNPLLCDVPLGRTNWSAQTQQCWHCGWPESLEQTGSQTPRLFRVKEAAPTRAIKEALLH